MVSVIEYNRILQVVFETHYYLIQEQCLCCQSQSPMKLVMIFVVQNSAVDVFTSSTEMVVTDAEVTDRHNNNLLDRTGRYILWQRYKVCIEILHYHVCLRYIKALFTPPATLTLYVASLCTVKMLVGVPSAVTLLLVDCISVHIFRIYNASYN